MIHSYCLIFNFCPGEQNQDKQNKQKKKHEPVNPPPNTKAVTPIFFRFLVIRSICILGCHQVVTHEACF